MHIFPHVTKASLQTDPRVAEILLQNIPPEEELALEYARRVSCCRGRQDCPGTHVINFSEGITRGLDSFGKITFQCHIRGVNGFVNDYIPQLNSKVKRANMVHAVLQLQPLPLIGAARQSEMKKDLKTLLGKGLKRANTVAAKIEAESHEETRPARRIRTLPHYYPRSSPLRPAPHAPLSRQANSSPISRTAYFQDSHELSGPTRTPSSSGRLSSPGSLGSPYPPKSSEPSSTSQGSDPFDMDSSPISLPSLKTIVDRVVQERKRKVTTARMSTGGRKPVPPFLAPCSSMGASSSALSSSSGASSSKDARVVEGEDLGMIDISSDSDGECSMIWMSPLVQKRKRSASYESPTMDRKGKRRAL